MLPEIFFFFSGLLLGIIIGLSIISRSLGELIDDVTRRADGVAETARRLMRINDIYARALLDIARAPDHVTVAQVRVPIGKAMKEVLDIEGGQP
jgi:hypothetical protein